MNKDSQEKDWNFRVTEQRLIVIKTINTRIHKAAVSDILTNVSFALNIHPVYPIEKLEIGKEYLARLNVFTSKNLNGIDKDFISFFETVDVNQSIEDFIRAYWVYPTKIRFDLIEVEES